MRNSRSTERANRQRSTYTLPAQRNPFFLHANTYTFLCSPTHPALSSYSLGKCGCTAHPHPETCAHHARECERFGLAFRE
eukprot:scaffold8915_cov101-Isochrysis_galbana.AAC.1